MTKQFTRIEPTIVQHVGDKFKRDVVIKHFRTDDGLEHEFTTMQSEDARAGAVIALTPEGQVITSYQFRAGPEEWLYETPGGGIEEGEDPEVGVMRELREETGYSSDTVTFLGTSSRGSIINETWYYYLALDCYPSQHGRELDQTEIDQGVEVRLVSISEFIDYAKHDKMSDPHAVLMAYDQLKELEGKYETTN